MRRRFHLRAWRPRHRCPLLTLSGYQVYSTRVLLKLGQLTERSSRHRFLRSSANHPLLHQSRLLCDEACRHQGRIFGLCPFAEVGCFLTRPCVHLTLRNRGYLRHGSGRCEVNCGGACVRRSRVSRCRNRPRLRDGSRTVEDHRAAAYGRIWGSVPTPGDHNVVRLRLAVQTGGPAPCKTARPIFTRAAVMTITAVTDVSAATNNRLRWRAGFHRVSAPAASGASSAVTCCS